MLHSLHIRNYALIAELDIQFHRGFSVITGETGAGKSILLGAIGLLLGQRAETRMLKAGAERCIIEAEFDLTGYGMDDFFASHDLDFDGRSCIIRRELTAAGKSRAFINDTPAQVTQLKELGARLIDIHSQHQNLLLSQEDFQLSILDIIAHDEIPLQEYHQWYEVYQQARRKLKDAQEAAQRGREDEEYLRFQLAQLDELHLTPGRQAEAEIEVQQLVHAEEIKQAFYTTDTLFNGDGAMQPGVLQSLRDASRQLSAIAEMMPEARELQERIDSCCIELKDVSAEAETAAERVAIDPERLQATSEWLSALYTQQQRHHVTTEDDLISVTEEIRSKLELLENYDEHLQELQQGVEEASAAMLKEAAKLTKRRNEAAREVERQMQERLAPLGIPNVQFKVSITPLPSPDTTGADLVCFLFSANKNGKLEPISSVASGGEIARVMLSLKAMISNAVSLPTIIFDEIDTGVSGHIAERMAQMMREMGDGGRQVISITHLPQIAACGKHHYRVFKEDDEQGTSSHIVALNDDERVTEIANMLSGTQITEAAIQNARELLKSK